jgi:7,8-dihydropterin-6-yl-methyl-4-(beta-D-ribofuranosyl)aminobenzene 5'-phosphate synthase
MKVRVLMEDTSSSPDYRCEHGLSLLIETKHRKILFDMGQTGLFLENADKMSANVGAVDVAVLSHGHYDHGGGILAFLTHNRFADVLVHPRAFEPHFSVREGNHVAFIGLDPAVTANSCIKRTEEAQRPNAELTIFSGVPVRALWPPANRTLLKAAPDGFEADDFAHEQHLIVTEDSGDVLFTGCAHCGIVNILEAACALRGRVPRAVVGGFHLVLKGNPQDGHAVYAAQVAEALSRYESSYYTGHCTGEGGVQLLKEKLGERVHRLSTGIEFNP